MNRYPTQRGGLGKSSRGAPGQPRRLSDRVQAFVGPIPALPVIAPAVATPAAAVPAASNPLTAPLLIGFGIGVGIGLTVLWLLSEEDPDAVPDYTFPPGWNHWCSSPPVYGGPIGWVGTGSVALTAKGTDPFGCGGDATDKDWPQYFTIDPAAPYPQVAKIEKGPRFGTGTPESWVLHGLDGWSWPVSNGPITPEDHPSLVTTTRLVPGYGTPARYPGEHPELAPIMQPAFPTPQKWADAVADPGTQPAEETSVPDEVVTPRPSVVTIPALPFPIVTVPGAVTPPGVVPRPDVVVQPTPVVVEPSPDPDGPPIITYPPGGGWGGGNNPPGRNTKERKVNVQSVAGRAWFAINLFTEGLDFLDVLWNAIDPDVRTPRWSRNPDGSWNRLDWNDKLADLYNHWDEIDIAAALAGFVNNQFEDMVYGLLGRQGVSATQQFGILYGLNTAIREAQSSAGSVATGAPGPLPELTYDRETGEFGLEWELMGWSYDGSLGSPEKPGTIGHNLDKVGIR